MTDISIHALREERDVSCGITSSHWWNFNPRAPRGARRDVQAPGLTITPISIHALREERDEDTAAI